jgi:hypothetical protein
MSSTFAECEVRPVVDIGTDAPEVVRQIALATPHIAQFKIVRYRPPAHVQGRLASSGAASPLLARASALKVQIGIPFWDGLFLAMQDSDCPDPAILDAALFHQETRSQEELMSREEVVHGKLARVCEGIAGDLQLAIASDVVLADGAVCHMELMDFRSPTTASCEQLVAAVCGRLMPRGYTVLMSGGSYHAYGVRLLDAEQFRQYLGRALLFAPVVDRPYIAHQLVEGRCALRISRGGSGGKVPVVIRDERTPGVRPTRNCS